MSEINCVISCDGFRLYYLLQRPGMRWIEEEGLMTLLHWSSPAITALVLALHTGENILLHRDHPLMFHYSYCSKSPFPYPVLKDMVMLSVYVTILAKLSLITILLIYIFIFFKLNQLQTEVTLHVVLPAPVTRFRHQRNVISAKAHFLSFLVTLAVTTLILASSYGVIYNSDTGNKNIVELSIFFLPSVIFVVNPLIETMFSENLRDSLFALHFANLF